MMVVVKMEKTESVEKEEDAREGRRRERELG